jgi:general secretion pathway protein G
MTQTHRTTTAARVARQAGFTIMEVLIVLAIIALIMGVLIGPKLFGAAEDAKVRTAHTQAVQLATAYARWSLENTASCPESIEELAKYLNASDAAKDPWGNDFIMACGDKAPAEAGGFGILSKGKDGKEATDDDVKSWEKPKKK